MKKRVLSLLLAVLIVLALVPPAEVRAAEIVQEGKCGNNAAFTLDSNGVLTISGMGAIYSYAFEPERDKPYCGDIQHVVIQSGITEIGTCSFYNCENISSVTLPNTLTKIGFNSFYGCTALANLSIPKGIVEISDYAFGNTGLTKVSLANPNTILNGGIFSGCRDLMQVTLPQGMTRIPGYMFHDCNSLTDISIPESVESIGDGAFQDCTSLTELTLPESLPDIPSSMCQGCTGLQQVNIPQGITWIGFNAFQGCTSLRSIVIPGSVLSFGEDAFGSCTGLVQLTFKEGITKISRYAFRACTGLTAVAFPVTINTIERNSFVGCKAVSDIYYAGTEDELNKLNHPFSVFGNPEIHYNTPNIPGDISTPSPVPTPTPSPSPTPSAKPTIPPDAEASGTCGADGDNLVWWVKDGTLTIAGEGEMEDYSFTEKLIPPWMGSAMEIKKVLVEDGPTSIGAEAFYLLSQCSEIFLGKDIRSVRRGALCAGSASLWLSVVFEGDPPEVLDEAAFPDKATIYYKTGAEALESDWVNAAVKHFYAFDISKTDKIDRQVSIYPRWVYQEDKAINKLDIDNTWNFTNNAPDWPDAEANKGYFITRSNYNKLLQFVSRSDKKSLTTSSAKAEVFKKKTNFNIDGIAPDGYYEWWNGSCYGMAVTVAAAMNHCIVPSMLPGSSGTLFSIEEGKTSIHISRMTQSLINFYHMQQNLKAVQDKSRAITQCERQMEQLIMLDKTVREAEADGRGVVISFDMRHRVPGENGSLAYSTVGHTVTGYAVEDGIFPMYLNGQYYIFYHRVLTYDPAYSGDKQKDYDFALYYNDTVWAIPGWGADDQFDAIWALSTDKGISLGIFTPTRTDNCAQLTGLLADDNFINAIDYRTGLCNYTSKSRGASPSTPGYLRTSAQNLTLTIDGQEVEIKDSLFGGTTTVSDTGAMILFPSNGVGDGSYTIVLPEGAEYSIAAEEDFACSFETDDFYLSAGVQGAGRASFTPSGTVDLNVSGSAPVYASLTANNSPTWHNFEVASPDAGHLLLELTDNGLEIWGDDLRDTAVTAYDQEEDAKQANFTASEGNVLVTDENEELVIMTDPDGDGVYDVPLEDQEPIPPAALQFSDVKPTDYFYHAVAWAVAQGITGGTSSTTFSPGNTCTREQIMTFLWAANGRTEPSGMAEFDDMPKNTAFQKAISWAVEKKITAGTGGNKFGSKSSCTRGQAMVFLWTAAGRPEPSQIASFADMPDNSVFQKAISWAKEEGITSGTSATTFSPNKPCTRAQIMTFLYHVYQ